MKKTILTIAFLLATNLATATSIGLFPINDGQGTVGDPAKYAVIGGTFSVNDTTGLADIVLKFNYLAPCYNGPRRDLGAYQVDGIQLNVGDLLFQVGSQQFGIALASHSGAPNGGDPSLFASVLAGHVYSTSSYILTDQTINDPYAGYRRDTPVWMGATVSDLGSLSETIHRTPGTNTYTVEFIGTMPQSFMIALETARTLNVQFGSATCANGYMVGSGSATPEPMSLGLVGAGLAIAGLKFRRRKAS